VPTRALTWAIFVAAAGSVAAVCVAILRPFAHVIAWSAVLAILCYPLQEALVRRTRRVALSALLTSSATVLVCLVPLLVLAGVAVDECAGLAHSFPRSFQAEAVTRGSALIARITGPVGPGEPAVATWVEQHLGEMARGAGQYAIAIANGLLDAVISSVLVIFTMFLLLRDGKALVAAIPDFLPFERRRSEMLLGRIKDVVLASVHGVVVIAVLQGALCGAMFWVLGIPAAVLWGAVTVFASVLPVVGAFAVWGPGVVYLALTGAVQRAIVLAIWGTFAVSGIDNVLRPRLVAGRVGLSELAMFFALLGGLSVFGALGVVLGPVAFATAAAIVETLRQPAVARSSSGRQS
jgi:predicted PurR-regulated permease PerM